MWIEFVGSLLCSEKFFPAGTPVLPSDPKPTYDSIRFVVIQFDLKSPQLVKLLCSANLK